MNNKPKTYRVTFVPIQTLEYEYVIVTDEGEDEAYYQAKHSLQEDIGWDAAKEFDGTVGVEEKRSTNNE